MSIYITEDRGASADDSKAADREVAGDGVADTTWWNSRL